MTDDCLVRQIWSDENLLKREKKGNSAVLVEVRRIPLSAGQRNDIQAGMHYDVRQVNAKRIERIHQKERTETPAPRRSTSRPTTPSAKPRLTSGQSNGRKKKKKPKGKKRGRKPEKGSLLQLLKNEDLKDQNADADADADKHEDMRGGEGEEEHELREDRVRSNGRVIGFALGNAENDKPGEGQKQRNRWHLRSSTSTEPLLELQLRDRGDLAQKKRDLRARKRKAVRERAREEERNKQEMDVTTKQEVKSDLVD
uniref:Uncharacterized protein n=1 Tax=Kwoniella dejecticola CBS 10117 TaxID=1296121 RepID=A0A1A6A9Q8_9TREE|nr:uncharacterized protein I303_02803 [Kwoniella dejecticola CBS 10117]OBR86788.1 hypothetical protein I303_02803 [Kwoniella dejecticola CBS 10117]